MKNRLLFFLFICSIQTFAQVDSLAVEKQGRFKVAGTVLKNGNVVKNGW